MRHWLGYDGRAAGERGGRHRLLLDPPAARREPRAWLCMWSFDTPAWRPVVCMTRPCVRMFGWWRGGESVRLVTAGHGPLALRRARARSHEVPARDPSSSRRPRPFRWWRASAPSTSPLWCRSGCSRWPSRQASREAHSRSDAVQAPGRLSQQDAGSAVVNLCLPHSSEALQGLPGANPR